LKNYKQYITLATWLCIAIIGSCLSVQAQDKAMRIVVDANGKGDYTSIQAAINSLPATATQQRIIFIKKGIYNEKVLIEKDFITLEGEDKANTILTQSIARDAWRCEHADDWGVATLNLRGSDLVLMNLTVQNNFGFEQKEETTIACTNDTTKHEKKLRKDGHQMALRSFQTIRLKVINCNFKAFGGDTVSPWNVEAGMFYFKDCTMEGGVDFYCPRGWAYAENCTFIAHTGPASIWHDGSKEKDAKTVLVNCSFKGYDGFKLGRYHRDAQFYLVNCSFADNMADQPIYQAASGNELKWGERVYYYNCHRKSGDYQWFANNLDKAAGNPSAGNITSEWTFAGKWHPAS